MTSKQIDFERLSKLEQQYISQLQESEKERSAITVFQSFLSQESTREIPGVDDFYVDNLANLVTELPKEYHISDLLTQIIINFKSIEDTHKVEYLQTSRALLINFVKYLKDYDGETEPVSETKLTNVEYFYYNLLVGEENYGEASLEDFARFLLDNEEEFTNNYNGLYNKMLVNIRHFIGEEIKLSVYYEQMVIGMKKSPTLQEDLTTLNSVILRYIDTKNN